MLCDCVVWSAVVGVDIHRHVVQWHDSHHPWSVALHVITNNTALTLGLCCVSDWFSHCTGQSGLAGTRMSPLWILLGLNMMEVVVTTGATRLGKLQSDCHRHQQTNTNRPNTLRVIQQCQSTERKKYHIPWTSSA